MTLIKRLIHFTYRPAIIWYLQKDRSYDFQGLNLWIKHGVFHPGFFFSTKLLIKVLENVDLKGKSLLELGCGSGLISAYSARAGADVTASDINAKAVINTIENLELNHLRALVVESDLFDQLNEQQFDIVVINPPYYPKTPTNASEEAWFCGVNFEYFQKLFASLKPFMHSQSLVIMSLSEDCDIDHISSLASKHGFELQKKMVQRTMWERHFVFQIAIAS